VTQARWYKSKWPWLLMAAPAARILVSTAERLRRQDWTYLLMTAVVVLELAIVLWRAAKT